MAAKAAAAEQIRESGDEEATRDSAPATVPAAPRARAGLRARAPLPDNVLQALVGFAASDYAREECKYCGISPTEYGNIRAIFQSVEVQADTTLKIRLTRAFEQRSVKFLDVLAKHLRQSTPHLKRLLYEASNPPTTRTIIISP